ncbi:MAG: hypothetical protein WCY59_02720 [Anaerovoracaceae bacterium]
MPAYGRLSRIAHEESRMRRLRIREMKTGDDGMEKINQWLRENVGLGSALLFGFGLGIAVSAGFAMVIGG